MMDRSPWADWAHFLQRYRMEQPAAVLLEAAGPLTVLLAQMVYLGQPLLGSTGPQSRWTALAHLLEDREAARSFAAYLREEGSR